MLTTPNVSLTHYFTFKGFPVHPGMALKVKGIYGLVTFECIVHDLSSGKDYLLIHIGTEQKRMVSMDRLMDVVVLKRTIRKKINESRITNR